MSSTREPSAIPTGIDLFGRALSLGVELLIVAAFAAGFLADTIRVLGRPE